LGKIACILCLQVQQHGGADVGALIVSQGEGGERAAVPVAADWTQDNLCTGTNQILRSENQGDGGAFKGIFVRYMKLLVRDCGCEKYVPWMQANANTAWRNRGPSDNIMGYNWSVPTGSGIQSQSASSAVSLLLCFSDDPKQ
jgi:predicted alpha-1,6-mannanase (GH76 family)